MIKRETGRVRARLGFREAADGQTSGGEAFD